MALQHAGMFHERGECRTGEDVCAAVREAEERKAGMGKVEEAVLLITFQTYKYESNLRFKSP